MKVTLINTTNGQPVRYMEPRKEIKTKDIWSDQKQDDLKKFILSHSGKQQSA